MKLVIDIDEDIYKDWKWEGKYASHSYAQRIILNGKPLWKKEWIPVTERLPEKNGRYLVTRGLNACGAIWKKIYIINYSDLMGLKSEKIWWDGNVGKSDFKRIDDVIAWMPLPEHYTEV